MGTAYFALRALTLAFGGPPSSEGAAAKGSSKIASWGDFRWRWLARLWWWASSTFDDQPSNGYLLRNLGDGSFADVTTASRLQVATTGNPCAVLWSDFDNDGDQDLWVWNDRGDAEANRVLLRNEGGERFTDITADAGISDSIRQSHGHRHRGHQPRRPPGLLRCRRRWKSALPEQRRRQLREHRARGGA